MDSYENYESNPHLDKYVKKVNVESIVKSIMFGASIAFGVSFIFSLIGWLVNFSYWWISFIIFAAVTAALSPLAYFKKFKPDIKDVARRVDKLGLEERVITMVELEGTQSVMASHQLNSTTSALAKVSSKMLPIVVSTLGSISLALSAVLGTGMLTVHALSTQGYVPGASEVPGILNPVPDVYLTLRYKITYVDEDNNIIEGYGAEIDGNEEQIILEGTDAEPVMLYIEDEPEDENYGWEFAGWYAIEEFSNDYVDGSELGFASDLPGSFFWGDPVSEDPYRWDTAVTIEDTVFPVSYEDDEIVITFNALVRLKKMSGANGQGEGEDGEDGEEQDGDTPPDEPSDSDQDQQDGDDSENKDQNPGDGAGSGKYDAANQIIDGGKYYREHLEDYMAAYQEYIASGKEIPEYLKKFIETYYDIIK